MLLEPTAIRDLKDNGEPLHLTVVSHTSAAHIIRAEGRGAFGIMIHPLQDDVTALLHHVFSHYPSTVTIGNERVERTPFPDLSVVQIAHAPSMERAATQMTSHRLGKHGPGHAQLNTYAGGLLTDLVKGKIQPDLYLTEMEGPMPHWKPCGMVITSPVYVLTDEELDSVADPRYQYNSHGGVLRFREEKTIQARAKEQMARTLQHPGMPTRISQDTFHYVTGAPLAHRNQGLKLGSSITANSTPAVFRDQHIPEPTLVSTAQALYRTDAGIVPTVAMNHCEASNKSSLRTIDDICFTVTPADRPNRSPETVRIRPVRDITLWFRLNDDNQHQSVPAPFVFHGNGLDDLEVDFVPARTSPEDLQLQMVRAYREYLGKQGKYSHQDETDRVSKAVAALLSQVPEQSWRQLLG